MVININSMFLKVVEREACLCPKSIFGFVKRSWAQKGFKHLKEGRIKRSEGFYKAAN